MTLWTSAHQAYLSFTISQSLLKLMSLELVMPSNHLILWHSLLLLPSVFPSIRFFPTSRLFASGGQSIGASVTLMCSDGWKAQIPGLAKPYLHLFIWLHQVLVAALRSFIASYGIFHCGARSLWLWRVESVVVALGLSCSKACEILVPPQNIEPASPTLQGAFLTTESPGTSWHYF